MTKKNVQFDADDRFYLDKLDLKLPKYFFNTSHFT